MAIALYPSYVAWQIALAPNQGFFDLTSQENTRRIKKALAVFEASTYRFQIDQVDSTYLDAFVPLYENHIQKRQHAAISAVRQNIGDNVVAGRVYESISLLKDGNLIGGLVYSVRSQALGVAYRVFPHTLDFRLPVSCSYVAEYYLVARAKELGKSTIIHGRDRNPYGLNAAIGLADYKLRVGALPFVSTSAHNKFQTIDTLLDAGENVLVFLGEEPGQPITKALLFIVSDAADVERRYAGLIKQTRVTIDVRVIA